MMAPAWIAALSLAVMAGCCFDAHRRAWNLNPGHWLRAKLARLAAKMAAYR